MKKIKPADKRVLKTFRIRNSTAEYLRTLAFEERMSQGGIIDAAILARRSETMNGSKYFYLWAFLVTFSVILGCLAAGALLVYCLVNFT